MNKVIRFIPLILFVLLAVVLYRGLSLNPEKLPSALIGKPVPAFTLSQLKDANTTLSAQDLTGDIVLLNVWATWCPSCRYEHPYLLDLAKSDRVKLYGLNYKDERDLAITWLNQLGDPYEFSIFDDMGRLGLDLGVYAAPETFVIDHNGIIRKRFAGPIDAKVWQDEFEPLIRQLEAERAKG
ncbi:DsbE family thiol:disulfide interchange protein [Thalassotalea sp. LPB0316]|uniref:DsbE family thiol:disulfide interchange protein n=1 Tax=Thalassotalea sp. LPB0316 TaxID=2769490 RepID=UPI001865EB97|nr:DsbE family thiol:disulfide interchange protein [Thalassotalea sp. LPB0316]QOL25867.1 DsbE family thiol:disulfide interchange protein [Thalassotalea sp. LPB0316]